MWVVTEISSLFKLTAFCKAIHIIKNLPLNSQPNLISVILQIILTPRKAFVTARKITYTSEDSLTLPVPSQLSVSHHPRMPNTVPHPTPEDGASHPTGCSKAWVPVPSPEGVPWWTFSIASDYPRSRPQSQ